MDTLKLLCIGVILSAMLTIIAFCAAYKMLGMMYPPTKESKIVEIAKVEPKPEAEEEIVVQPQKRYLGRYKITGYDTCAQCCGKDDGITASGEIAKVGRTCAAPKNIPFGTKLYIEGIGERIVEDRGGFDDNVIDVLCENHSDCYALAGYYDVYIMEDALNA